MLPAVYSPTEASDYLDTHWSKIKIASTAKYQVPDIFTYAYLYDHGGVSTKPGAQMVLGPDEWVFTKKNVDMV